MATGDGIWYDESKLPRWVQDKIAVLQAKAALVEELVAACKRIAQREEKSALADCAYQGPPPKKWLRETLPRYEGYNEALRECKELVKAALAKADALSKEK